MTLIYHRCIFTDNEADRFTFTTLLVGDEMSRKTATEMAEILTNLYEDTFGGKKRGRYQITRSGFTELSGRKKLQDSFIYKVIDEALDWGYIVVDLGDYLVVIEVSVTENYRQVPKSKIKEITEEDEEEEYDEDE